VDEGDGETDPRASDPKRLPRRRTTTPANGPASALAIVTQRPLQGIKHQTCIQVPAKRLPLLDRFRRRATPRCAASCATSETQQTASPVAAAENGPANVPASDPKKVAAPKSMAAMLSAGRSAAWATAPRIAHRPGPGCPADVLHGRDSIRDHPSTVERRASMA